MGVVNISNSGPRLPDIERAKGLAILLVVFGHIVARDIPAGNEWYAICKEAVYSFHMAFFMFLSGCVFFLKATPAISLLAYIASVRKRFMRLMPAYFLFSGLVFAGKWGAQNFLHVDNPVGDVSGLLSIVLYPMQSVASFLWFIYVLFLLSLACLALLSVFRGRLWPLLVIGIVLQFAPSIPLLGLGQFAKYFLFFVLGGWAIAHWGAYTAWLDRFLIVVLIVFVGVFVAGWYTESAWRIPALLSIPALHGLCRRRFSGGQVLVFLGGMTFSIYLMNTMAIGIVKALLMKFMPWDGSNFVFVFLPALMAAGVLIPVCVKKYIFPKFTWLDRITN